LSRSDKSPFGSKTLIAVIMLAVLCTAVQPVDAWNHSEIEWKTIRTDHFEIHFHPGEEWSAIQAAAIAEEVYAPITEFYGYAPSTVHITLFDKEDDAEGATYYYMNRIDISASPFDFHLRGTANWLRNVITHEFTHMVSVQRSMKLPIRIPAVYFQVISFEKEKRPDVLTGYPNFQVSLPFSGEVMPNWFAEGIAQYQCGLARNDIWDSHRDMLLRTAVLEGELLTIDDMGVFGKNSLKAEMVYNQGFSLVRYIAGRYGYEGIVELTRSLSSIYRVGFGGACRKVLGISEGELYRSWRDELEREYGAFSSKVKREERKGRQVAEKGFLNIYPVADGKGGLFFLSNENGDYMDLDLLHVTRNGAASTIVRDVTSRFDVSPDGKHICYTRRTSDNPHGYEIDDVFVLDLDSGKERRLTRGLRATDPCWSPNRGSIACAARKDGSERIAVVDVESGDIGYITPRVNGRQYFGLSWGRGGILASVFEGMSRDIVLIDSVSGESTPMAAGPADERDAVWSEDGSGYFYSSDRTGVFNIYHRHVGTADERMLTNVLGGAFFPSVEGGNCLYAGYGRSGYGIYEIARWDDGAVKVSGDQEETELMRMRMECIASPPAMPAQAGGGVEAAASSEDSAVSGAPSAAEAITGDGESAGAENFGIDYTRLFFFPTFLVYEETPRIGLFVDTRDILDRQSVTAGGTINADKEFDLQLSFETRQFKPTFSFDLYRSRKYYTYFTRSYGSDLELYYRYDLWDAFFSCSFELEPETQFRKKEIALQYNHGEYGLNFEIWELVPERQFRYAVGWNYYKANEYSLIISYRNVRREVDADINPRGGRRLDIELTYANNKLSSGDFEFAFKPIYDRNDSGRYILSYEEHIPLPLWSHALSLFVKGGALDSNEIDDFFHLYIGGRDGLKGYSYYSMGGRRIAMGRVLYRFPIVGGINRQFMHLYFGSLYAGIFAEAGKAWNSDELDLGGSKRDYGFELRLKGFSFYNMPLAASFEAAYGLDDVSYTDPFNQEIAFYEGKNWKYYGTVLFGF
jgi:hypothetical protein